MKKQFLAVVATVAVMALLSFNYINENKGVGRVQKIMGKECYVLCEPLREYEVTEDFSTGLATALIGRKTIQAQLQEVIKRGMKREEKGELKFDAALTDDGERIVLIKFKD